jgi:hypothetical protein
MVLMKPHPGNAAVINRLLVFASRQTSTFGDGDTLEKAHSLWLGHALCSSTSALLELRHSLLIQHESNKTHY